MNARTEFLGHVKVFAPVLAAVIEFRKVSFSGGGFTEIKETSKKIGLRPGYSQKEFEEFLLEMDFEYDDGYGSQELFGVIWYTDGTWSEREEYDGSEDWTFKECPIFPNGF